MSFGITYYYVLLISTGVSLLVIVWLVITIRNLQASSEEHLKRKVLVSERILRMLHLDEPQLDQAAGSPAPDAAAEKRYR